MKATTRHELLLQKLIRFYSVMGHRPDDPGALSCMAEILEVYPDALIDVALNGSMRECRFPVRMPDILTRIPGQEVPQLEAEGRKAWDLVLEFTRRYVDCDAHGNYGPEHGWYANSFPKLSQRILDTVRRTGGWRAYKCMTDADYPHQQKRFLAEYTAWAAVEQTPLPKLLTQMPALRLIGKMDKPKPKPAEPAKVATAPIKPILHQEPMTEAQLADRREMLRQQTEQLRSRR
jgi:hypothetical protein